MNDIKTVKKSSDAHLRASAKYYKNTIKRYSLHINKKTNADMINHLDNVINERKQTYIKRLIQEDMKNYEKKE